MLEVEVTSASEINSHVTRFPFEWNLIKMFTESLTRRPTVKRTISRTTFAILLLCLGCQIMQVTGKYSCKDNTPANCRCSKDINGNYDLLCPLVKPTLMLLIESNTETNVKVQCDSNTPDDFKMVSGANIGETGVLTLKFCSIPNAPFESLMESMGIPKIDKLEISYSSFDETIGRKHFEGFGGDIDTLRIDESNLTVIPDDLFQDVVNLTWLSMRGNFITDLPKDVFRPLTKLVVLELGKNKLKNLEPGVFNNLTRLRLLNIWSNQLTDISRAVFTSIPNLESLDLSLNNLVTLRVDLFADLSKLGDINLSGNEFVTLPQNLFLDNPMLKKFTMNKQPTLKTVPSQFLANLNHLQTVQISRCQISSLPKDVFWNSTSITSIFLNNNQLTELPTELFKDNVEVKKIDISSNQLTSLPDELFKYNKKLTALKASHNRLKFLSGDLLGGLYELDSFDMSYNVLEEIHPSAFQRKPKLETINLSHNLLTLKPEHGSHSPFHSCLSLKFLMLANNSIDTFFEDWHFILTSLQLLDLKFNKISIIQAEDLQFNLIENIMKVDLSNNNISKFDMSGLESIAKHQCDMTSGHPKQNELAKIVLAGNPLECDCKIYDFLRFLEKKMIDEAYCHLEIDATNLFCSGPGPLQGKKVATIPSKAVVCDVHHLHELVNVDDRRSCPSKCECSYRPYDSALLVDCIELGLTHLDHNFMLPTYNLYTHFSKINHTILYLSKNELKSLPHVLDKGFKKVTKLYLSSNNFTSINITQLSPDITVLDLDNNNISRLDDDSINFLQSAKVLERLSLQNNRWKCDCDARNMLNFIQENIKKVEMISNITCAGGDHLIRKSIEDICPISTTGYIVIGSFIAGLGILIGLMAAFYYRYQLEIKVWLYAHQWCLWFVTEEDLDKDKIYDAFISYSHHDEDFVIKHLVRKLEEGSKSYKLCLHYRDWIVGDWIPNQIANSVENSKRTIVVLSPNFLDSVWSKMEFRTAHKSALKERREKVILIMYKDIGPTKNLDPELKAYMDMNTYLKWGDPWFWDKLYYALPHPLQFSNRIPMLSRSPRQQQAPPKPILDLDKTDLIKGSDPNASPPATTTPPAETYLNAQPSFIPNGRAENGTNNCAKVQVKV